MKDERPGCELPACRPSPAEIEGILESCRKIAVVGISPKESRDSHKVARYLIEQGYEVVPVNPGQTEVLGRPCYRSLMDIPFAVDMADLFLNSERVPPVVDQAIERGIPVVWMQIGVIENQAAEKAQRAGVKVVMDRCVMQEHKKLAEGKVA